MVTKLFTEYPDSPLLVYAAPNKRTLACAPHTCTTCTHLPAAVAHSAHTGPAVSAALRATLQVSAACDVEYCMLHLACPAATWHARWAAFAGVTCALVLGSTILVLVFEPMSAGPTDPSAPCAQRRHIPHSMVSAWPHSA